MDVSDSELLERWRAGDRSAGAVLFERYYVPIERFFVNKVGIGIADLVQETFKACVEARDRVNDSSKFRSYLFSIAYNVLRSHVRSKYRSSEEINLDDVSMQALDPGPRSLLVERDEQRLLLEGLRHIEMDLQIMLELRFWENMKVAEIAHVLNIPEGTVKSRLSRARKNLEEAMEELADSPVLLRSTMADLESWAKKCREAMGRASSDGL